MSITVARMPAIKPPRKTIITNEAPVMFLLLKFQRLKDEAKLTAAFQELPSLVSSPVDGYTAYCND